MAGKRKAIAAAEGSKKRARVAAAAAPATVEEDGEWEIGSDFDDDSGSGSGEALQGFVTEADADAEVDDEAADVAEESGSGGGGGGDDAPAPAAPATSSSAAAAAAAPVRRSAVLLEGASVPKRKVRPVFATAEEAAEQEGLCDRMKFLQRWSKHFDAAWLKHTQSIGVGRDPGMQTPAELRRSLAVCMASLKKAKKIKVVRENKAWVEAAPAPAPAKKAEKEREDGARPTPDSAAAVAAAVAAAAASAPAAGAAAVDVDEAAAKEAERARKRIEGEERRRDKMKERREKKKQERRSKKEAAAKEAEDDELATLIHLGGGRVFDALEGRRRCLVLPDPLRPARVWFLQKRFRETGNAAPGREDRPRRRAQDGGEEEVRAVGEAEAGRVAVGNLPPGCVRGIQGAELLAVLARCGQLLDCEFQRGAEGEGEAEEAAATTACEAVYPSLQHARAACDALKGMPFGGRTLTAAVVRSEANARSKNMY